MSTEIDNIQQMPIQVDLAQEFPPTSPVGTSASIQSASFVEAIVPKEPILFVETTTPSEPIVFQESRSDKPEPSTLTTNPSMEGTTRYLTTLWTPKGGTHDIQTTDAD